MRFPHSHSLDDDPFVALHTINERSPSHHLIPLGSSFDEKMLVAAFPVPFPGRDIVTVNNCPSSEYTYSET
jgi:hypothetical protein